MEVFFITHPMLKQHAIRVLADVRILLQCRRLYSRRTHYDVLNLKKDCSNDEIRQSFAKLSKKYHPDTSKDGNTKQNSHKFQEIIEAYKILNKKSTRAEYDTDIATPQYNPYYAYNSPYNASSFKTTRGPSQNDFSGGSWQHMHDMHGYGYARWNKNGENSHQYYRCRNKYDDPWAPPNLFGKKRIWGFLSSFILMNFFTVFFVYSLSRKNRLSADFEAERKRFYYEAERRGFHGPPRYSRYPRMRDDSLIGVSLANEDSLSHAEK